MHKAIQKVAGTSAGKEFFLQYMKKGQSFFGIRADKDGDLCHKKLNIYDIRNGDNVNLEYRWIMQRSGIIANGLTGFDEESGDIDVYIGTANMGSEEINSLIETISHELGKHATRHKRYLKLLESNKINQLHKERKENYDGDHYESSNPDGAKVYNQIMRELKLREEWKKEQK